jgi:hypothetical protein
VDISIKRRINPLNQLLIYILFLFFLPLFIFSQDLDNISKSKILDYSGGINLSGNSYGVEGMDSRMDPYSWMINANLNLNFLGIIDAPFSAHFTKQDNTYNQPSFNQFGTSPRYKYITTHLGYRNMQFSNYSLSGVTFLGAGVEIKPENSWVRFSTMYGKFAKAVPYQPGMANFYSNNMFNMPGYERWGYGAKLSVGPKNHNFDLLFFRAADDINSIPLPDIESNITPKENLIVGFATKNKVTKNISINTEYNLSALSNDIRIAEREMNNFSYINNLGNLFTPRYSSTINSAYGLGVDYVADIFAIGLNFKRIDPGYQSLGTTFMSNDIEDYVINFSAPLFKKKVNLSMNSGMQRNNLDKSLASTNTRVIGGFNITWNANEKLLLGCNYSNFTANTNPASVTIRDTFKYAQITSNISSNINYNWGGKKSKHTSAFVFAIQSANMLNQTATLLEQSGTQMFNTNAAHTISIPDFKLNISGAFTYNYFIMQDTNKNTSLGPTLGIVKQVFNKKITLNINHSIMKNNDNMTTDYLMNISRFGASYKINKFQSLRFATSLMSRKVNYSSKNLLKNMSEYRAMLTYSFIF